MSDALENSLDPDVPDPGSPEGDPEGGEPAHDAHPDGLEDFEPEDGTPAGSLDRSVALVRFLRQHCPWDRKQTPRTLIPHLLEESHEAVDAIRAGDAAGLEGELGDLLLNVAFQIVLGEEAGDFDGPSVVERLELKMIRRHPHLFGGGERQDWEELKARERLEGDRVLKGLASGLDPLLKAYRMQDRVAGVGFDWPDAAGALAKVREELAETEAALSADRPERLLEELGDLLFAVVNLARLAGVHPDAALDEANTKFQRRFEALEDLARERGVTIPGADLEALDALWDEVKERSREAGGREDAGGGPPSTPTASEAG
jgi:MazG family protein